MFFGPSSEATNAADLERGVVELGEDDDEQPRTPRRRRRARRRRGAGCAPRGRETASTRPSSPPGGSRRRPRRPRARSRARSPIRAREPRAPPTRAPPSAPARRPCADSATQPLRRLALEQAGREAAQHPLVELEPELLLGVLAEPGDELRAQQLEEPVALLVGGDAGVEAGAERGALDPDGAHRAVAGPRRRRRSPGAREAAQRRHEPDRLADPRLDEAPAGMVFALLGRNVGDGRGLVHAAKPREPWGGALN